MNRFSPSYQQAKIIQVLLFIVTEICSAPKFQPTYTYTVFNPVNAQGA